MLTEKQAYDRSLKVKGFCYTVISNGFEGRTHNILPGMLAKECEDGWFQLFKENSNQKHFTRVSAAFIEQHKNNFKKVENK